MTDILSNSVSVACFGRACRGEHYSGDLAYIHQQNGSMFIAVVDAAGHGRSAHSVSYNVETIFLEKKNDDLIKLTQLLHETLLGGPGAVIIVGVLDTENLKFSFVHIGDTHGKVFGPRKRSLVGQAGMLGHAIPTPIIQSEVLSVGDTLVLSTDGISERFELDAIKGQRTLSVDTLARKAVEQFGKDHDDATCLIVRCE